MFPFYPLKNTVTDAPTPIYKDKQTEIDIVRDNHIPGCVNHIASPVHYFQWQHVLISIDPVNMKTTIQPAGICTKRYNLPLLEHHYY